MTNQSPELTEAVARAICHARWGDAGTSWRGHIAEAEDAITAMRHNDSRGMGVNKTGNGKTLSNKVKTTEGSHLKSG